jgi:hypothetical protein
MASIIWNRDPQEAINNPYEYNAQKQFHREAIMFSDKIVKKLCYDFKYSLDDRSLRKATWMLQTDSLFAFKDALLILESGKHRVVGRFLRDILETVHLVEYFNSKTEKAENSLKKWFDDEIIMDREFRDFVKKRDGEVISEVMKIQHRTFSKFTHRSYNILLYGYILGRNDRLFYDKDCELPQSAAMYYALLGQFGQLIKSNLGKYGDLTTEIVDQTWNDSMEKEQMPRGYLSAEDKKFLGIKD